MLDKNGKKIFEGDILLYVRECTKYYYEVEFRKGAFEVQRTTIKSDHISFNEMFISTESFEVVGNIHDNPELLKEGAEK